MTLLFLLTLVLVAVQAFRIPPPRPLPFNRAWRAGEQILPVAVPPGEAPIATGLARSRLDLLRDRSVEWSPGTLQDGLPCEVFLRISRYHWARLRVSRHRLAELLGEEPPAGLADSAVFRISPRDILEDRDGDGDPLDSGELRATRSGVEAELFCSSAPEGRKE